MGNSNKKEAKKRELSEQEIEIILSNTKYTREGVLEFYSNFVKAYPNGFLFKEDFIKLYKELYPQKECDKFLEKLFLAFDQDNSGFVTFSEFLIAISLSGSSDPEKKLHLAFLIYDTNRNGRIEKHEIDAIIKGIKDLSEHEELDEVSEKELLAWDKDGNGYLTEDEFIKYVVSNPKLKKYLINCIKAHD